MCYVILSGYSGDINLLMVVFVNGEIVGVCVIKYEEILGFGDKVEVKKLDWIIFFKG